MSGSSRASRVLSRCVVTMDTGINISWQTNPDGSYPGTEHHAREEAGFLKIIDNETPAIERLLDEMEESGWQFTPTSDASFNENYQFGVSHGLPIVELQVLAKPELSEDELMELTGKVARLLEQKPF